MIELLDSLVNSNSISRIALVFFLILVLGVGWVTVEVYKVKSTARAARDAAVAAEQATKPVSNGFAGNVYEKLDKLIDQQDTMQNSLNEHLAWHLRQEQKNG